MHNRGRMGVVGVLGLMVVTVTAQAAEYRCQPSVKHHCSNDGCASETDGFQHAEQFFYNSDGPVLGACLWTVCYGGKAQRFVTADGFITTVVGQLDPEHSPELYAPMLITLTLDGDRQFTATWQHQGRAVVVTHGRCEELVAAG